MSLGVIRATFRCDGCDGQFRVDIDPNEKTGISGFGEIFDYAMDALRGGIDSEGGFCSDQGGLHLCSKCTAIADSIGDENHEPTRAEVEAALDKAAGRH